MAHRSSWTAAPAALLAWPATAGAQSSGEKADPAGGAAIGEVIIATGMAVIITGLALIVIVGHRSGRIPQLGRLAGFAERVSGVPGWTSLPFAFVGGSLVIAVIGMYWDISLHIGDGRDPGPLANPAHYLILFGLFGIFIAGLLAMALPEGKPSPTSIRIHGDWYAPLGGVLMTACSAFALSGFPLDDVWHRIFGQDVTLWGPTHLMLIGGASLCTLATAILVAEGLRAASGGTGERTAQMRRFLVLRQSLLAGAFLVGLSTFQAEFDFSVPQFRLLYHPVLLMLASSIAFIAARIWIGRGGALLALGGYLLVRVLLTIIVGPLFGEVELHFPLYAAEALAAEAVALFVSPRRPVTYGAVAGAFIGTFGLAAEWGWSHVWMTIAWPSALLPEAVLLGVPTAVAGGVLGAAIGRALAPPIEELAPSPRWAVATAMVVALFCVAYPLPMPNPDETIRADITLTEAAPAPERRVNAEVKLTPPDAAEDVEWFNATAWQGGGAIVADLEETGPGTYRTTEPIPVYGNWKSTLRLQTGASVLGLPVFMPEDRAIPAPEIPAEAQMTRDFVRDKKNLQREQKGDVPGWVTLFAYLAVLAISLGIMAALTVGLIRMDRDRARVRSGTGPGTGSPSGNGARFRSETGAPAAGATSS